MRFALVGVVEEQDKLVGEYLATETDLKDPLL